MSQPWSPEVTLTKEEAKSRIGEQFPELHPVKMTEIGKYLKLNVWEFPMTGLKEWISQNAKNYCWKT
jgi:hypothetical protein